jgi:hypothetical protein
MADGRWHEGTAVDQAPLAGSPIIQDCGHIAEKGASRMTITDLPAKVPGLDVAAACASSQGEQASL